MSTTKTQIPFEQYQTDLLALGREGYAIVKASFERNGETIDKADGWKYLTAKERAIMQHIQNAIVQYVDDHEVDTSTLSTDQQ
jgi:hypothetical protein